jgi:hypothetical protein
MRFFYGARHDEYNSLSGHIRQVRVRVKARNVDVNRIKLRVRFSKNAEKEGSVDELH